MEHAPGRCSPALFTPPARLSSREGLARQGSESRRRAAGASPPSCRPIGCPLLAACNGIIAECRHPGPSESRNPGSGCGFRGGPGARCPDRLGRNPYEHGRKSGSSNNTSASSTTGTPAGRRSREPRTGPHSMARTRRTRRRYSRASSTSRGRRRRRGRSAPPTACAGCTNACTARPPLAREVSAGRKCGLATSPPFVDLRRRARGDSQWLLRQTAAADRRSGGRHGQQRTDQ